MDTEADFRAALAADPADGMRRLAFADWLDDRGDPRGPGYRALVLVSREACRPAHYWYGGIGWVQGAYLLPADWHALCPREWYYGPAPSAEDAAAVAFAGLPPGRQAELLSPVSSA